MAINEKGVDSGDVEAIPLMDPCTSTAFFFKKGMLPAIQSSTTESKTLVPTGIV